MNFKTWIFLFLLVCVSWVPRVICQTAGTGALTGTVKDPSGAVIPNATVTITSVDTGQVRTTMTGADGVYKFSLLPPGNYRVRIEAGGFKPVEFPSATITVTETAVLDRALEVGAQNQSVTVESEVEAIQTASSTLGTVVNTQTVVALPLSTRNFTNLLAMSAGANADVTNSATIGKSSTDISVNGGDLSQNTYLQDGVSVDTWLSLNSTHASSAPVSRSEPSTSVHSANGRLLVTNIEPRS
jgi:carboxypeptidase family protein